MERDKFLTEAMGLEYIKTITGGKFGDCIHYREENGEDYIVMSGVFFFLLWDFIGTHYWREFMDHRPDMLSDRIYKEIAYYINPDRFANAVYEFLKERT